MAGARTKARLPPKLRLRAPYEVARAGKTSNHAGATMKAVSEWLRRRGSVSRRGILVAVTLSMLGSAVADGASAASKSTSGGATLGLPKTSAEVAPFVAPMD